MLRGFRWLPFALLIVLILAFFHKSVFTNLILARGDAFHYFYPYWDARHSALQSGQLPLWTADLFMGAPLLANPQLGTLYPPNWLLTPLTAPDALQTSIVLHLVWAGAGMLWLVRRTVSAGWFPALVAGLLFTLGGYLGAHVEQINQLQGLSWLPWLLLLLHQGLHAARRGGWFLLLAAAWALQLFTGHTQTVFVTGVGLGVYALSAMPERGLALRDRLRGLLALASAALGAGLLALPQLLPTLELTGMSQRGGGLNPQQATAFSLPPGYLGHALLPFYDGQLFGEYIGYVGIVGLGLALYGLLHPARKSTILPWALLALLGLVLALGRFNPLYWLLAELPGFNLFRVPARWLALYALGMSVLAAHGVQRLQAHEPFPRWRYGLLAGVLAGLLGLALLGRVDAVDMVGSVQPGALTGALWLLSLLALAALFGLRRWMGRRFPGLVLLFLALELFAAAQVLPYNDLAPRDVYLAQRFTVSQMLAYGAQETPPGRTLSISRLQFDPGDLEALRTRYERLGMSERAVQIALTAIKKQEILAPSLGLHWGIPSVDGYGGGLLPTVYYSQFTSLLLPEGTPRTVDGRIGEALAQPQCRGACLPPLRWLRMSDIRYIITDKVFDVAHAGLRYDTALSRYWHLGMEEPDFAYTELHVLHHEPLAGYADAASTLPDGLLLTALPQGADFDPRQHAANILAITAVDTRTGDFLELQPAGFQRVLSSDIKLYTPPYDTARAVLANRLHLLPDDWNGHEAALHWLRDETTPVLHGEVEALAVPQAEYAGSVHVVAYEDTRVELQVRSSDEAYLILRDAYYPGWQAQVNGEQTDVFRANVLFRAVRVPAGESTVVFTFVPQLWYAALGLGALLWGALVLVGLGWLRRRAPRGH